MTLDEKSAFWARPREDQNGAAALSILDLDRKSAGGAPIVPVILSGGAGSRLWPFSTEETPKQFLPLTGPESLFRQALTRVRDRSMFRSPIVVANARHAHLCEQELEREDADVRLILEPAARNTAAAIAMAATVAAELHGDDAVLVVMPSDHVIEDLAAFHRALRTGEAAARAGRLVTFGIHPTSPDTGYGYLHMGSDLANAPGAKKVVRFVEKPCASVAEAMVESGEYLWNAGIFMFTAAAVLGEARRLVPEIAAAGLRAIAAGRQDGRRVVPDMGALMGCPSESIDYAIMERSNLVAVVPMSPGWSDLGSWDALASMPNAHSVEGPVTTVDCSNCFVRSDSLQIAALGVDDLIIVAAGDRLLILPRGRSQEVKRLIQAMSDDGKIEDSAGKDLLDQLDSIAA